MLTEHGQSTCSGTSAFVAEKWGRRWITCDTTRASVTLAKQRLMTASYDYYELKYPQEGLKSGFIYGFPKNERATIENDELKALRLLARELLGYSEQILVRAVEAGELIEVSDNGEA